MRLTPRRLFPQQVLLAVSLISALSVAVLLVRPEKIHAQQKAPPTAANVGVASPLAVYMTNEPPSLLPEGFAPGTSWKFTTWTIPSTLTFTASVEKTEGGWAYLKINTGSATATRWYFIPEMPGAWEPQ